MESLYEKVKAKHQESRILKLKDVSLFLSTVIGEFQKESKTKDVSDETATEVLRKMRKSIREVIGYNANSESVERAYFELKILEEYLPSELSEQQLLEIAVKFENMGEFQKYLKANHSGLYDGALASKVFKSKV